MEKDKHFEYYSIDDKEQKRLSGKMELSYVAFLDILGFKNMVMNNSEKVLLTLRQIRGFCNQFYGYDRKNRGTDKDPMKGIPLVTMFSDSVMITAPTCLWFLHEFVDLISHLQYFLLTQGVLLRGGIDVGKVFHDNNYLFGKGLVGAYLIECNISKYPRIVISNRAIKFSQNSIDASCDYYIDDAIKYNDDSETIFENIEAYFTHDIFEYVTIDKHGIYYLEYLIRGYSETDDEDKESHFKCISQTISEGLKTNVESVREKYVWLDNYFSRVFHLREKTQSESKEEYEQEEKRLKSIFEKEKELAIAFEKE